MIRAGLGEIYPMKCMGTGSPQRLEMEGQDARDFYSTGEDHNTVF